MIAHNIAVLEKNKEPRIFSFGSVTEMLRMSVYMIQLSSLIMDIMTIAVVLLKRSDSS